MEADLFESVSAAEQKLYRLVALCYLTVLLMSLVTTSTFMWLVSSSYFVSILGAIVLSFAISNMIRFAWLNLVRSLHFQKEQANLVGTEQKEMSSSPNFVSMKQRLNMFKASLQKNNSFGLGTLIRAFIFAVLIQLIVFPWMTLIHWQTSYELTKNYRTQLIQQVDLNQQEAFKVTLSTKKDELLLLNQKLIDLSKTSINGSKLYQNLSLEKIRLQNDIAELRSNFEQQNKDQLARYSQKLEKRYFPILTFKAMSKLPDFILWELVIGAFVFLPFYLMKRLNNREEFHYAEKCQIRYRSLIFDDYDKTKNFIETQLNKFGLKKKYDAIWEDPPFYTRYKSIPSKKQLLPIHLLPISVKNDKK